VQSRSSNRSTYGRLVVLQTKLIGRLMFEAWRRWLEISAREDMSMERSLFSLLERVLNALTLRKSRPIERATLFVTFLLFLATAATGIVLLRTDRSIYKQTDDSAITYLHGYLSNQLFAHARHEVRSCLWSGLSKWDKDKGEIANEVASSYDQAGILIRSGILSTSGKELFLKSSWGSSISDQWELL